VEDCGSGIDTQVVSRIFDPLFTTKREGLGMGLAICRSIVEAHGGRIWISKGDAQGSVFSFSVPSS
jgi:signal transduction histidine kinase